MTYTPWDQFVPYFCLIIILYINLRKRGRWLKYNEWLSYLTITLAILLELILGYSYEMLIVYFNALLIAYMNLNKTAKGFSKAIRKRFGVWIYLIVFGIIGVIFSIDINYAPVVYVAVVSLYFLMLIIYKMIVSLDK